MTKLNNKEFDAICNEINAAMAAIAKKYNLAEVNVDVRRFRSVRGVRIMKTDLLEKTSNATNTINNSNTTSVDGLLAVVLKQYNLRQTNDKGDKIIGYHPNRPKFCIEYESVRGKRWLTSIQGAKSRFG